jgi:hypothetical protein
MIAPVSRVLTLAVSIPKRVQLVEKVGVESVVVSKQYRNALKTLQNRASQASIGGKKGHERVFQQCLMALLAGPPRSHENGSLALS